MPKKSESKAEVKDGPIDRAWLASLNIFPSDAGKKHPDDEPKEFGARIVGGDDTGWKKSSDDDKPGEEITELVIELEGDGRAAVYLEAYTEPRKGGTHCETKYLVPLGYRHTRAEILELCRALKAWGIRYPLA